MSKVVIIGSGFVGSTIAYTLQLKELADEIVLIDLNKDLVDGEIMDMSIGLPFYGKSKLINGCYMDCEEADIIVITAGVNRKVGQTRDDLLETNKNIINSIMNKMKYHYNNAFTIIVSNPVDKITSYVGSLGMIPKSKLAGTGCLLDTARYVIEISKYLNIDPNDIKCHCTGEHGSNPHISWNEIKIKGELIENYCKTNNIYFGNDIKDMINENVKTMGADIIKRKGKTHYGIAMSVAYLVNCLQNDYYTEMSLGNVMSDENCASEILLVGNYEIKKIDAVI